MRRIATANRKGGASYHPLPTDLLTGQLAGQDRDRRRTNTPPEFLYHAFRGGPPPPSLGAVQEDHQDRTYWDEEGMFEPGRKYCVGTKNSLLGNLVPKVLTWGVGRWNSPSGYDA